MLPAAAREASEAGARAFVGYYWELVNYAQATGDVRPLRRVSGPRCSACSAFVSRVRKQYRRGGHIIGGTNTVSVGGAIELGTRQATAFGFRVTMTVLHDAQTLVDKSGAKDLRAAGSDVFVAYLLWVTNSHWRLDVLELAS